jgi:hypothetical protein
MFPPHFETIMKRSNDRTKGSEEKGGPLLCIALVTRDASTPQKTQYDLVCYSKTIEYQYRISDPCGLPFARFPVPYSVPRPKTLYLKVRHLPNHFH